MHAYYTISLESKNRNDRKTYIHTAAVIDISNIVNSYSKYGGPHPKLFAHLSEGKETLPTMGHRHRHTYIYTHMHWSSTYPKVKKQKCTRESN